SAAGPSRCIGIVPRPREEAIRDAAERLSELARDDPDLVRVALRNLRQHLEILVGEKLLIGISFVDRLEDGLDRLGLAFGGKDRRLPLALGPEDRRLFLAL